MPSPSQSSQKPKFIVEEEELFEIAINAGAKDCVALDQSFEITTEKEDFYKIKTELEKKINSFNYSSIEWRPLNYVDLNPYLIYSYFLFKFHQFLKVI